MPMRADDEPTMVDGWYALHVLQERGRASARRLALEMIGRPIRRAAHTEKEAS